ncbi:hypothetical protein J6590_012836 [Homalodisca vitripennis]|nr:hypothetical protein J6590_012836 [Homalodisca vitripennis]
MNTLCLIDTNDTRDEVYGESSEQSEKTVTNRRQHVLFQPSFPPEPPPSEAQLGHNGGEDPATE